MINALQTIQKQAAEALDSAADLRAIDDLRVRYLGKKGELTAILKQMGKLSAEERPKVGQLANEVRAAAGARRAAWQGASLDKGTRRGQGNLSRYGLFDCGRPGGRNGLLQL